MQLHVFHHTEKKYYNPPLLLHVLDDIEHEPVVLQRSIMPGEQQYKNERADRRQQPREKHIFPHPSSSEPTT